MSAVSISSPGWIESTFEDRYALFQWLSALAAEEIDGAVIEVHYTSDDGATIYIADRDEPLRFPLAAPPPEGVWHRLTTDPAVDDERQLMAAYDERDHILGTDPADY